MLSRRSIVLGAVALCTLAPPAVAGGYDEGHGDDQRGEPQAAMFGRMFPDLPAFTGPTTQQVADLVQTMLEDAEMPTPTAVGADDPGDNRDVLSGFTYLGQFLDHDLTRDESPPPTGPVDPTTLVNHRTPVLDLDSVYGDGPEGSPELYAGDKFRLTCMPGVPPPTDGAAVEEGFETCDVPRDAAGHALIGDSRNDENLIVLQLHVAFERFHNALIDSGKSFEEARRVTVRTWQHLILTDYLPKVVGKDNVYDHGLMDGVDAMPVEFAVAAFRFGHSEVRADYQLSDLTHPLDAAGVDQDLSVPVFSFTDPRNLNGGRPLPRGLGVDWAYFFDVEGALDDFANFSRRFDDKLSPALFQLPIPGAEATGSNVLPFRTLTRGLAYGLPSGQDVAERLGVRPLRPWKLDLGPGFEHATPLFFYVLKEAELREDGMRLGPVGGAIVTDVILSALRRSPWSVLERPYNEWRYSHEHDGDFEVGDLLLYGGAFSEAQLEEHLEEPTE